MNHKDGLLDYIHFVFIKPPIRLKANKKYHIFKVIILDLGFINIKEIITEQVTFCKHFHFCDFVT